MQSNISIVGIWMQIKLNVHKHLYTQQQLYVEYVSDKLNA
jgi:hypothetical protein